MMAVLSIFVCLQPTSTSSTHVLLAVPFSTSLTHVLLAVIDKIIQFPLKSSLP
ncbi:hypothetical protein HanPI659440_Chr10g0363871 [Helianthus annuus]|nr:hypothetical protein HanPI659440_Chr10g0363871 [Helianthus annuus]